MTPGGFSDAKVFAEFGIPAVNLSVGYQHKHTEFETLDYKTTLETFENNMIIEELVTACKG
jgi:tripeptide aminopeptidase